MDFSYIYRKQLPAINYLAHIYLSFVHEELTVGNFISDTLRGTPIQQFTEGVQNGIRLHRRIDLRRHRPPQRDVHFRARVRGDRAGTAGRDRLRGFRGGREALRCSVPPSLGAAR